MNEAHYHMLVNHFPIIGLFFGFTILFIGILRKNTTLRKTAYFIFIFCMIMGKISMMTGDKAEHFVEDLPGFSHEVIHEHEEAAEAFMIPMYILSLVSIFGLVSIYKNRKNENFVSYSVLGLALIAIFLSKNAGTTGGEIRHTEIRENSSTLSNSNTSNQVDEEENE